MSGPQSVKRSILAHVLRAYCVQYKAVCKIQQQQIAARIGRIATKSTGWGRSLFRYSSCVQMPGTLNRESQGACRTNGPHTENKPQFSAETAIVSNSSMSCECKCASSPWPGTLQRIRPANIFRLVASVKLQIDYCSPTNHAEPYRRSIANITALSPTYMQKSNYWQSPTARLDPRSSA